MTLFILVVLSLTLSSCSSNKQTKAVGDLKKTQYCKAYKKFESEIPMSNVKTQKKMLENILATKDFPSSPKSLRDDYETLIDGYDKYFSKKYDIKKENKYKDASERIQKHAIVHCETLKSNSGSSI